MIRDAGFRALYQWLHGVGSLEKHGRIVKAAKPRPPASASSRGG
jgi:hypothetical protein